MQMVARLEFLAEPVRMSGVTHRCIEVDDTVEGMAGPDPFVHGFANSFAVGGKVACTFIRCDGGAENPEAVRMGTVNKLLHAHDKIVRCDNLAGKRILARHVRFGARRLHMGPANIVDALEGQ